MSYQWETLAPRQAPVPADMTGHFTIEAPPKCDVWRSRPDHNVFDAPAIITRIKASQFKSISVTVSANWKTLYDQGGLLLVFPGKEGATPVDSKSWIKAGVENEAGMGKLGVVATYAYSDWSLSPMLDNNSSTATLKMVRKGSALWIYAVHEGQEVGLREVTWAFLEDRTGDADIWVGVYAAKPTADSDDKEGKQSLKVEYADLKLQLAH